MSGLIHIYTGDGKGKTTAAFGLGLRFLGHDKDVLIVQFLKGRATGEVLALSRFPSARVLRNSRDFGFFPFMDEAQRSEMLAENNANLLQAKEAAEAGSVDLLILDEAIGAYGMGALDQPMLLSLLKEKAEGVEIVLTGRSAPEELLALADYVSDIHPLKHPYEKGVKARECVEF